MYIYDKEYFYNLILKNTKDSVSDAIREKCNCYKRYSIEKKNGQRKICSVIKETKIHSMQVELKKYFEKIPISPVAKGFVKGESYFHFLYPHINKKYYMRMDIKNFFGSINYNNIKDSLATYCKFPDVILDITEICTLDDELPQGAVTSPVLSNIVFAKVDQRIMKYCQTLIDVYEDGERKTNEVVYTRYADDLLFSSDYIDFKNSEYFRKIIKKILLDNGYKLNYEKLKFGYEQISLSGHVVCNNIHLSRKKLRELKTILYYFDKRFKEEGYDINKKYRINRNKFNTVNMFNELNLLLENLDGNHSRSFNQVFDLVNYLCGYRSFLISINEINEKKDKQIEQNQNLIKKIEVLVDALSSKYGV